VPPWVYRARTSGMVTFAGKLVTCRLVIGKPSALTPPRSSTTAFTDAANAKTSMAPPSLRCRPTSHARIATMPQGRLPSQSTGPIRPRRSSRYVRSMRQVFRKALPCNRNSTTGHRAASTSSLPVLVVVTRAEVVPGAIVVARPIVALLMCRRDSHRRRLNRRRRIGLDRGGNRRLDVRLGVRHGVWSLGLGGRCAATTATPTRGVLVMA
jgi:hypothetical protein